MSERSRRASAAARGGDGARKALARRNAWVLAGLAVFFYIGYMLWMTMRAQGG